MSDTATATTQAAARHTPGPWRVVPGKEFQVERATAAYDRQIAHVYGPDADSVEQGIKAAAANAYLIAAAPDMLAALRQAGVALAAIRGEQFRAPQMSALDAVRAAIAKAEAR